MLANERKDVTYENQSEEFGHAEGTCHTDLLSVHHFGSTAAGSDRPGGQLGGGMHRGGGDAPTDMDVCLGCGPERLRVEDLSMQKNDNIRDMIRELNRMMLNDPNLPQDLRMDIETHELHCSVLDKIKDACSSALFLDKNEKQAWLEYLTLMAAGLDTFLESHPALKRRRGGGNDH